jgi:hypothetical protein
VLRDIGTRIAVVHPSGLVIVAELDDAFSWLTEGLQGSNRRAWSRTGSRDELVADGRCRGLATLPSRAVPGWPAYGCGSWVAMFLPMF